MSDSANIVLRFSLYVDLLLLFGVALFGLYSLRGQERVCGAVLPFRSLLSGATAVAVVLSIVGMLLMVSAMSGVVNYLFIAGPKVDEVFLSTYGILLFIKVALFAGMLVLAALNRFHLGPFLERSLRESQYRVAANALRRSVLMELVAAVLIVGLVAWLGTLSPQMGEQ